MKRTAFIATAVAAMVLGIFAYAGAATTATDTVNVKATVNPKITLTLDKTAVDFGAVDPEANTSATVGIAVKSNKDFKIVRAGDGTSAAFQTALGLTQTAAPFDGAALQTKSGNATLTDTYTINVPWSTTPGDYVANYTYTVTQQ